MAIIMNIALAKHVCKVSKVSGYLISVRLLFKNKLSVSILSLYADASALVCFFQANDVNALIARAINESSFLILEGDFNEDGLHRSASFRKCGSLGLVNSLVSSLLLKILTWSNSWGVMKTIDYLFVSPNLVNAILNHNILDVVNFFDTDHQAVSVLVGLGGLLNTHLCFICKQANKDHWKYNYNNTGGALWSKFKEETTANAVMFFDEFLDAKRHLDLNAMWDAIHKTLCFSVNVVFKKKWFKEYDGVFTKISFRFHRLELLVSKLVKASRLINCNEFTLLLNTWIWLDSVNALLVKSLFFSDFSLNDIWSVLFKIKKSYHAAKLLDLKCAEDSCIKSAINRRMETFKFGKGHTIKSVLEHPFCKVILDYLVVGEELFLEPNQVKNKVNEIMEGWTQK
ncbi:hypothetical protein G9A89_014794 [Geosiphon pyriformis]|nr:hypothetical protein G9A89_014794 [Geosiphon pyriformis]